MIVQLDPLPYTLALKIIKWCFEHDIDKDKCVELIHAMGCNPTPKVEWELDIPEKYVTWFVLKWGSDAATIG
jgi:hypothetical protein